MSFYSDEELIEYSSMAKSLAAKLWYRLPRRAGIDLDDLISTAYVGLVKANIGYSEIYCKAFNVYAWQRINGEMLDYLRSLDMRPRFCDGPLIFDYLSHPVYDEDETTGLAMLESHYRNQLDELLIKENSSRIILAIDKLDAKTNLIIEMYFFSEITMKEIGKELSLSEARISQIIRLALQQLRYILTVN